MSKFIDPKEGQEEDPKVGAGTDTATATEEGSKEEGDGEEETE